MDITQADVDKAKDALIADLINQNLGLRAQLAANAREPEVIEISANGEVKT